ncbi:MAG: RNA ligase family protein [Verrucomicrobia bacterium]|nr:RNA ligase family protein [Verrucomicrobiota bacterium]
MPRAGAEEFLQEPVVVEEKVDGANLGLSAGPDGRLRAQSRGNYLAPGRCHAQWNPLWPWLARRERSLVAALGAKLMLFAEWCHARHTIAYEALPDWFMAFDVFEPDTGVYWSVDRRTVLAAELGVSTVPEVFRGRLALRDVPGLLGKSALGAVRMEGIYLRREAHGRLLARAKVVGMEFKQQIEAHWTRRTLVPNRLAAEAGARS